MFKDLFRPILAIIKHDLLGESAAKSLAIGGVFMTVLIGHFVLTFTIIANVNPNHPGIVDKAFFLMMFPIGYLSYYTGYGGFEIALLFNSVFWASICAFGFRWCLNRRSRKQI